MFNLEDPDQKALYDHARKRTNFSAYVKRLILLDMKGTVQIKDAPDNDDDREQMKGFL